MWGDYVDFKTCFYNVVVVGAMSKWEKSWYQQINVALINYIGGALQ